MSTNINDAKLAAKLLGRDLCGRIPHVVSVVPRRSKLNNQEFELYVYIDSSEAEKKVPRYFQGLKVHVEEIGSLDFLSI